MKSSPARGCLCGSRSLKLVVPTGEPGCVFLLATEAKHLPLTTLAAIDPETGKPSGVSPTALQLWTTVITDARFRKRAAVLRTQVLRTSVLRTPARDLESKGMIAEKALITKSTKVRKHERMSGKKYSQLRQAGRFRDFRDAIS